MLTRTDVLPFIVYCLDDALSERRVDEMPQGARLVGWQCGFEPMFVAVWSYLNVRLDADEAVELATDLLIEKKWFSGEPTEPDFVL